MTSTSPSDTSEESDLDANDQYRGSAMSEEDYDENDQEESVTAPENRKKRSFTSVGDA